MKNCDKYVFYPLIDFRKLLFFLVLNNFLGYVTTASAPIIAFLEFLRIEIKITFFSIQDKPGQDGIHC